MCVCLNLYILYIVSTAIESKLRNYKKKPKIEYKNASINLTEILRRNKLKDTRYSTHTHTYAN